MYNKRLPLFITASCSFSRFDDFKDSGGEVLMTNEAGGALALISASRTVFAQPNLLLNLEIAKELLKYNEKTKQINTISEKPALSLSKDSSNEGKFLTISNGNYSWVSIIDGNEVAY
jgi:hypothetical protein